VQPCASVPNRAGAGAFAARVSGLGARTSPPTCAVHVVDDYMAMASRVVGRFFNGFRLNHFDYIHRFGCIAVLATPPQHPPGMRGPVGIAILTG